METARTEKGTQNHLVQRHGICLIKTSASSNYQPCLEDPPYTHSVRSEVLHHVTLGDYKSNAGPDKKGPSGCKHSTKQ
ncbi:hypothetical protein ACFX16_045372 [Malus domestica]